MFVIVFAALAIAGILAGLVYLWDFSRASRRDALFLPAPDRSALRARRVTGMYVRDFTQNDEFAQNDDFDQNRDELVSR